ncbi:hypothetical protein V6N13_075178 [Hibiscus sabdariffa]|uniref:Uncharacterized protein n=1 Tax=Hibiscus sabdariffa TaxID=183260 RepID=A0ABR2UAR8_9ROSI
MTFRTCQGSNYGICQPIFSTSPDSPASLDFPASPDFPAEAENYPPRADFPPMSWQQIFRQHCGHDIFPPGHQISHLPRSLPRQAWTRNTKWSAIGSAYFSEYACTKSVSN